MHLQQSRTALLSSQSSNEYSRPYPPPQIKRRFVPLMLTACWQGVGPHIHIMVQDNFAPVDDRSYFRELEATYLLRLLIASCGSTLESCAYEMQDASAILTAKMQSELPMICLRVCKRHSILTLTKVNCNAMPCLAVGHSVISRTMQHTKPEFTHFQSPVQVLSQANHELVMKSLVTARQSTTLLAGHFLASMSRQPKLA